jgi:hypothetical protein
MLCLLTKMERVQRLLKIRQCLSDGANNSSAAVTSQSFLKDPCQLTIPVVDKGFGLLSRT